MRRHRYKIIKNKVTDKYHPEERKGDMSGMPHLHQPTSMLIFKFK